MIDDYFKTLTPAERAALERIRKIVKKVAPQAEEIISYGMPGFKYRGKYLVGFAAFKQHLSIFPTAEPVEALKDKLQEFVTAKGTVQFTLDKPLPEEIIVELVAHRAKTIEAS